MDTQVTFPLGQDSASVQLPGPVVPESYIGGFENGVLKGSVKKQKRESDAATFSSISNNARHKQANTSLISWRCNAVAKPRLRALREVLHNGIPQMKWREVIEQDDEGVGSLEVSNLADVTNWVETIKSMLGSINDGETSISAYDTAWVALVRDIHGTNAPQFPSSLQWIVENQLPDGSWGDKFIFSAHDRILNTLACVIVLKSWNIYLGKCEQGMHFIRQNISKLEKENPEHMPIGFEIVFPSLIEMARHMKLDVLEDSLFSAEYLQPERFKAHKVLIAFIYFYKRQMNCRIPKDMMHMIPTTLLHSLEGICGLDWEKLLKLQCSDGSFLFSPSSTAFALMQTKDEKCLKYLKRTVKKFNGGAPSVYPVDLFEHLWAVDRLERLGISRYFRSEIKECLNYVYRYWTDDGICWARNSRVHDIDDTAMGFRLLRLHGHHVSPDVFEHFKKGGEFFCFVGQSNQAITGMFNLYRASQVAFPEENILEEAKTFSYSFLKEKRASNLLFDKWIISKDLPGEVGYSLDIPWYASLPRIETRFYIDQYGGEDDAWIAKSLYRMPMVNNNVYLHLAKLDFNNCQALHQIEWIDIQKWYTDFNLGDYGVTKRALLHAYFVAMSSIFEFERSSERLTWTQTVVLAEAISSYFEKASDEERSTFVQDFIEGSSCSEYINNINGRRKSSSPNTSRTGLLIALNELMTHGGEAYTHLQLSWKTWLLSWNANEEDNLAELLVCTIALSSGYSISLLDDEVKDDILSHPEYKNLKDLTNNVCHKLRSIRKLHEVDRREIDGVSIEEIMMQSVGSDMQALAQDVLQNSDGISHEMKQIFLVVAKSFFYNTYCPSKMIDLHIAK
ncbi:hypothetical protein GIB67_029091, partial [Kingdonia uniflora]